MKVSLTDIKLLRNSLIILELRTHWHFSHDMLNIVDLHISSEISFGLLALIDGIQIRWNFKQAILTLSWFEFRTKFKLTMTGLVSSDSTRIDQFLRSLIILMQGMIISEYMLCFD